MTIVRFSDFRLGDHVVFERTFAQSDFEGFRALSGDSNRLHHDPAYAADTPFGQPIVPLHMTVAPFSAIAGMMLPGLPSLYLGHELTAVRPVFFGETLVYSARISAISAANRVLTLSVLVLRGAEVVVEARMTVQARDAEWPAQPETFPIRRTDRRVALVTGATGAIGGAIARRLARKGISLILPHRGVAPQPLADLVRDAGGDLVAADLAEDSGREAVTRAIVERRPDILVHAAAAPLGAPLGVQMAVAYQALGQMVKAAMPGMLARQQGSIILIGSTAVDSQPEGWADYVAVKAAATNLVAGLDRAHAGHGIHGLTIAPGFVETAFSREVRPAGQGCLLPEEVAELADLHLDEGGVVMVEAGRAPEKMRFGFHGISRSRPEAAPAAPQAGSGAAPSFAADPAEAWRSRLADAVRRVIGPVPPQDLASAGLGSTAGWDSLRHIKVILEVEQELGISFTSTEIEATRQYSGLETLVARKLAG